MEKIQKLQELIKAVNDGLTKEDFLNNFKIVIDLVKAQKEAHQEKMNALDAKYEAVVDEVLQKLEVTSEKVLTKTQNEALEYCQEEMAKMHQHMKAKMAEIKSGDPGKDADEEKVAEMACSMAEERVRKLIPNVEEVTEKVSSELPQLGERIRDGLELLQGKDRLSIEAIHDLREKLDELEKKITTGKGNTVYVPNGGGGGGHTMYVYDLSSLLDGSTKTFNLPAFWRVISVQSSSFPNAFRPTTDYTTDAGASTITFTDEITASSTLAAGQTLLVTYSV